ncbi:MAG: glycoside hydrolase family 99-like domain-containing protein [Planctomycetes bacterium]|nr:glycoside hydrolase family 99-like domain-containing protein [Planctomycetota bacterium]
MTMRRALVASYHPPQPDKDSGGRRLHDLLTFLVADGWSVDFVALHGLGHHAAEARALNRLGIVVHDDSFRQAADGSWSRNETFPDLVAAVPFDLALLCFWPVAEFYLPVLRRLAPATRVIVDSVDLHFLREGRRSGLGGAPGAKPVRFDGHFGTDFVGELNAYCGADAVLTVSDAERDLLGSWLGAAVRAHTVVDCEDPVPGGLALAERRGVLLLGSYHHPPNVEALGFFCHEVLPLVDARLLERHPVWVVGTGLDDRLVRLAGDHPHVKMVGWVPDVVPYFHRSRATVVPLLHGAGTKRKLVQALVHGTPAVATPVGAEGLDLVSGTHALIAADAAGLAAGIERLLTDDALWERLATAGQEHVGRARSRRAAHAALTAAVADVLGAPVKPGIADEITVLDYHLRSARWHAARTASAGPDAANAVVPAGAGARAGDAAPAVRLIAFYLPQFHPIPENDAWWGRGFTEWRNVCRARPLFPDHDQPQLPTDLGFYDLRLAESRAAQAALAREHGIHGFCYYHYWFQGKRLLDRPFAEVLASGQPDFPFCLCWANEPWSRRWDGTDAEVLQPQGYSSDDDVAHIRWLIGPLSDPRAIRIDGKPLFLVYRADQLPDARATTDTWRREAARAGLPGLFLVAVETGWDAGWDATAVGFDAKLLFQPQFSLLGTVPRLDVGSPRTRVFSYDEAWPVLAAPPPVPYPRFETVFPGWDNSPRRGEQAWVVHGNTPESYEAWLRAAVDRAAARPAEERIVFVNAWNEWAEGAHLEPDRRHGRAFLEATRRVATRAGVPRP